MSRLDGDDQATKALPQGTSPEGPVAFPPVCDRAIRLCVGARRVLCIRQRAGHLSSLGTTALFRSHGFLVQHFKCISRLFLLALQWFRGKALPITMLLGRWAFPRQGQLGSPGAPRSREFLQTQTRNASKVPEADSQLEGSLHQSLRELPRPCLTPSPHPHARRLGSARPRHRRCIHQICPSVR